MSHADRRQRMKELLAEQTTSGLSKQDFCTRHGIKLATFYYWQRRLREPAVEAPAPIGFQRVRLSSPTTVKVHLPSGLSVEVQGPNAASVAALVRAIDEAYA